jgi:hypothetical protein
MGPRPLSRRAQRLADQASRFLEPGEEVRYAFRVNVGKNPYGFTWALVVLRYEWAVVAVTDRAVLVFDTTAGNARIRSLVARLPRATPLGPTKGLLFSRRDLAGLRLWIPRRWYRDVAAADAAIAIDRPSAPAIGFRDWQAEGVPNPGSDDARATGCTCPVDDNAHGDGWLLPDGTRTWDVVVGCPLHAPDASAAT